MTCCPSAGARFGSARSRSGRRWASAATWERHGSASSGAPSARCSAAASATRPSASCCAPRALRALRESRVVEANLIERAQLWGGASVVDSDEAAALRRTVRQEFLENLQGSDYCLALRGKGNYSFRFYELFSLGRIPLFIDTDCVLPFEDEIDWKRHCVWVDERDIDRCDEAVAQFHADLHADDFRQLQLDNRQLWLDYLSPPAIYTRILLRALGGEDG